MPPTRAGVDERIARLWQIRIFLLPSGLPIPPKGVAGNIGARELFKTATDIDTALKTEDMDKAKMLLPGLG